jgi:hypothetical protein
VKPLVVTEETGTRKKSEIVTDVFMNSGYNAICLTLGLFFNPEEGGHMFLSADYTASYPRKSNSSNGLKVDGCLDEAPSHPLESM